MKIQLEEWINYVPEWMHNRDNMAEDRVVIPIKCMTWEEDKAIEQKIIERVARGSKNIIDVSSREKKVFLKHVGNPVNLEINGTAIDTPIKLWENTFCRELVREVVEAFNDLSKLTDGDLKNFDS